jgi:hypothetical protein
MESTIMRELALAVCAMLAFLVPIGSYCFYLAAINRRSQPLLVRGSWDTVGLLFAASGFLLFTGPLFLAELYSRLLGGFGSWRELLDASFEQWVMLLIYLLFLISGGVWMVLHRAHKTVIYNVSTDQFDDHFRKALAASGVGVAQESRGWMTLAPTQETARDETGFTEQPVRVAAPVIVGPASATVRTELFPAMCNVTLHWDAYSPEVRQRVEAALARSLDSAAPEENPAAGWFLSISGLIFGALFMTVLLVLFVVFFPRQ